MFFSLPWKYCDNFYMFVIRRCSNLLRKRLFRREWQCVFLVFSFSFYFVFFFISLLVFLKREKKVQSWMDEGGGEDLRGNWGGETVIRIYCIKNFTFHIKMYKKNTDTLIRKIIRKIIKIQLRKSLVQQAKVIRTV